MTTFYWRNPLKNLAKMKLTYAFFIVLLLLSSIIHVSVQSSTTQLYVTPSKTEYWTPAVNEIFAINVSIANVVNLQGYEIRFYWNTTLLDLANVHIYPFLNSQGVIKNETSESLGRYWIVAITPLGKEPTSGNGTLFSLSFKVTYDPIWPQNATCLLNLAETILSDPNGDPIYHEVQNGEYWCYGTPPLEVTVKTSKQSYYLLDPINVYGNLTRGLSPFNWLVTIEVDNPSNYIAILRTLPTGNPPPPDQSIEIISVFPCDSQGNLKTSFGRGSMAYFSVTVRNSGEKIQAIVIAINLFDADNRAIGFLFNHGTINKNSTRSIQLSFPIPDTAALGNAWVYANALNDFPRAGGAAYCTEKSATFTIVASGGSALGSSVQEPQKILISSEGTYEIVLKLPKGTRLGNFIVFATSRYERTQTMDTTIFEGKVPDLNNDGKVNILDLVVEAGKFGKTVPPEDPKYDANGDGKINILDLVVVASYFGWS